MIGHPHQIMIRCESCGKPRHPNFCPCNKNKKPNLPTTNGGSIMSKLSITQNDCLNSLSKEPHALCASRLRVKHGGMRIPTLEGLIKLGLVRFDKPKLRPKRYGITAAGRKYLASKANKKTSIFAKAA